MPSPASPASGPVAEHPGEPPPPWAWGSEAVDTGAGAPPLPKGIGLLRSSTRARGGVGSAAGGRRPDGRRHRGPDPGVDLFRRLLAVLGRLAAPCSSSTPPPVYSRPSQEPPGGDRLSDLEISKIHLAELSMITEWEAAAPKASVSTSPCRHCVVCEVLKGFYFVCIYLFILLVLRLSASIFWDLPKGDFVVIAGFFIFFSLPFHSVTCSLLQNRHLPLAGPFSTKLWPAVPAPEAPGLCGPAPGCLGCWLGMGERRGPWPFLSLTVQFLSTLSV